MKKDLRSAVWIASGGTSDASGAPLDQEWEVDHVVPRSAGGTDDPVNLRATTRDENRSKGAALPPQLREWQTRFVEKWRVSVSDDFLLVALPGSGKTIAALSVAQEWIMADPVRRRVLIVVPTDPLRTQWKDEAAQLFGLQFQTKEFHTFKTQYQGGIVTYQLVASSPLVFKMLCSRWDTLVICDEIHHAGDQNEWGGMLREAISLAKRRLLMSGTPFRGDRTRIPFVSYDGRGECVSDDRYDYPSAIRDGVIRIVRFQHDKGIVRRISTAGLEEAPELHSGLSDDDADQLLRSLLVPGNYTETLLRSAHEKLMQCRKTMPTAAALALCVDQEHAEKISKQLARITGQAPDLVVSDDDLATSTVREFRDSNRTWVVAVKKISEGVDIKRLMVMAYLTTTRTELFFRQAVGRIVRNLGTEYDIESYCFIPDHPTLVRCAQNIVNAQAQAIEDDPNYGELCEPRKRESDQPGLWPIVIGTEYTGTAGSIIEGIRVAPELASRIQEIARRYRTPEAVVLAIVQEANPLPLGQASTSTQSRTNIRPLEDQEDSMRAALMKAIKRAAFKLSDPPNFEHVNAIVNQHIGKKRALFTLDDCRRGIAFAESLWSSRA